MGEINDIGGISLSLFQGIVMITLPLLLAGQTVLMFVFARYAVFNIIGRDYDAAVLSSGICGFDMGATTNAMANMQALSCSGRNEPTRSGSAATVWSRR
uniref:sodium/glutamate symporter n=1 Tax=Gemmiger formicilis TaxID=745368 RepID=UPI003FF08A4D